MAGKEKPELSGRVKGAVEHACRISPVRRDRSGPRPDLQRLICDVPHDDGRCEGHQGGAAQRRVSSGKVGGRRRGHAVLDAEFEQEEHRPERSEEHTSELQSLMRISYAVFCLKKKIIHHFDYIFIFFLISYNLHLFYFFYFIHVLCSVYITCNL